MADPVSASAAFAFVNSAFKLAEYAVKICGVESENGVFVRMIQRVRLDLEETERLLCVPSVKRKLISTPGKLPWIKGTIVSTKSALNEIGRWVERVRSDKEGYGSISWESRVRWVFNDQDKLVNRRMELGTSHQALSTVLAYLAPMEQTEASVDVALPQYDDATFFDDFLSPRQKMRKAWGTDKSFGAEKKDEGPFNKGTCRTGQASSSVFSTPQHIARTEVGSGDVRILGDAKSFQPWGSLSSSPRSSTGQRGSISSLSPSTIGSNLVFNSIPTNLLSEPATQEWSSEFNGAPPTVRSSSASTSSISRRPVSPCFSVSSMRAPMTMLPHKTSPTPSWAPENSPGYSELGEIPISPTSTSSWPITIPSQSISAVQQTNGVISPRPLNPSNNCVFPQELSSSYPSPAFQPPTSQAPQSFEGAITCMSDIYPRNTPSREPTSPTLPHASCQTSLHQFSATNFLGPIDPFELFTESDAQCSSISSQDVHLVVVEPPFTIHHPESLQNPPIPPKTCQSFPQIDTIAEMMGDLSTYHRGNHSSLTEIPKNISIAQSPSTNAFNEPPLTVPSWQDMPTSPAKMPGDAINRHATWWASAIEVPAEPYSAVERSQNPPPELSHDAPTSTYAKIPSHTISQVPQAHQRYIPSTTSWSSTQPQTQSQLSPQYQNQYQAYRPLVLTPVPHTSFSNLTSTAASSPISGQEQQDQQTNQAPVSTRTQEATAATAAQLATSAVKQGYSLSRSTTLGEARRTNQKALLDLMEHKSYG